MIAAATLSVTACTSTSEPPTSPTSTPSSSLATAPSDAPEDRHGATVTPSSPSSSPTWDRSGRTSARTTATRAITLYVRQNVDAEKWWRDLEPLLTTTAAQAYEGTDPTWGKKIKVSGQGKVLDGGSAHLARVHFRTNLGTYTVLLSRDSAQDPWLVERFTPPENRGD